MRKKRFTSPTNLSALTELEKELHTKLGHDLALKFYKTIPGLKKDNRAALKWILHNQQEVVGRCERYRLALNNLMDEVASSVHKIHEAFAACLSTLDHIRQNLTFLVSDYTPMAGYYTVDAELTALAITRQRVIKHYGYLIDSKKPKVDSRHLIRKFGRFCNYIKKTGCPVELADNAKEQVKILLGLFDLYYAEIESLVESPAQPTILLYRFRRVQSLAMKLLSVIILVQAITEAIWYFLTPAKAGTRRK